MSKKQIEALIPTLAPQDAAIVTMLTEAGQLDAAATFIQGVNARTADEEAQAIEKVPEKFLKLLNWLRGKLIFTHVESNDNGDVKLKTEIGCTAVDRPYVYHLYSDMLDELSQKYGPAALRTYARRQDTGAQRVQMNQETDAVKRILLATNPHGLKAVKAKKAAK